MRFDAVNLFLTLLFALLMAASASALEMRSSVDTAYISSTQAQVFVYAKNPYSANGEVQFSVSSNRLNAWFEPYTTIIRKGASAGAELHATAPDCFRGDEYVTVYAQVCANGECDTGTSSPWCPRQFSGCSQYDGNYPNLDGCFWERHNRLQSLPWDNIQRRNIINNFGSSFNL